MHFLCHWVGLHDIERQRKRLLRHLQQRLPSQKVCVTIDKSPKSFLAVFSTPCTIQQPSWYEKVNRWVPIFSIFSCLPALFRTCVKTITHPCYRSRRNSSSACVVVLPASTRTSHHCYMMNKHEVHHRAPSEMVKSPSRAHTCLERMVSYNVAPADYALPGPWCAVCFEMTQKQHRGTRPGTVAATGNLVLGHFWAEAVLPLAALGSGCKGLMGISAWQER